MTRLFFIEKQKFLRDLLDKSAKLEGLDCYTIDSADDCFYLIRDLGSELIIADIETLGLDVGGFFTRLEKEGLSQIPVVAIGKPECIKNLGDYSSKVVRIIEKPLPATGLIEKLIGKTL